jgi:predicted enzyme related to lactoylglutathione lyase
VVWHDLVTRDLDASKKFYGALFGWTWRAPTSGHSVHYIVGEMAGVAVAGLAEARQGRVNTAQWLSYFEVPNVKNTVRDALKAGGHVVIDPTRTAYQGESAVLLDPEGAPFAIMQASSDSATVAAPVNGWLWNELWTRNKAGAATFYGGLLGYDQRDVPFSGTTYSLLERDSVPRAGLITIPVEGVLPNWLPTIRVANVNAIVAKAVTLGGRVIMAPREDVRRGAIAIIADAQGAALAVQQWPIATESAP